MMMPPIAVLAGGLATRMRPVTATIPKAMIEVAGEPFIAHQLRLLGHQKFSRIVLCCGYLAEQIQDYVGDGKRFGLKVDYVLDGDQLLGTGGALRNALPHLGDEFFVTYGDAYLEDDYAAAYAAFKASHAEGLMIVYKNSGAGDVSNTAFDGVFAAYNKRAPTPAMQYIDWGVSILRATTLQGYPAGKLDLADVLMDLSARKQLAGYETQQRFYEIGSPEGLRDAEAYLAKKGAA